MTSIPDWRRRGLTPLRCGVLPWFATVVVACGDLPDARRPSSVDSAGVQIVQNFAPLPDTDAYRVSSEPLFRYGWDPDDRPFSRISDVALLDPDRVAVADRVESEIVILSLDGRLLNTIGRPGEGPGEFKSPRRVVAHGTDTLLIQNSYFAVSIYHDTDFVGQVPAESAGLLTLAGVSSEHLIFGPPRLMDPYLDGGPDQWIPLPLRTVPLHPGEALSGATLEYSLHTSGNIFAPQGVVAADGEFLVVGRQDRPELRWMTADGTTERIVRWEQTPPPATDSVWRLLEGGFRAMYEPVSGRDEVDARLANLRREASDVVPLFGELLTTSDGEVWMSGFTTTWSEASRDYAVIGSDGVWKGRVTLPPRFTLMAVGHGFIVGVQRNDVDVEALVAFELLER